MSKGEDRPQGPSLPGKGAGFEAGIFLVDKPEGPTSFRIVQQIRRALQIKKVGHTGTLDPFASGLLIVCAGRAATKIIPQLMAGEKAYVATIRLGIETDTLDREGIIVAEHEVPVLDADRIEACLQGFRGPQLQAPPAFSAVKHKGKPLYQYARKGIVIEKEARPITIHALDCLSWSREEMVVGVRCSKGTYIRTLAADIGKALGCGAHLTALRRTANGLFRIEDAVAGAELEEREGARELLLGNVLDVSETLSRLAEQSAGARESETVCGS